MADVCGACGEHNASDAAFCVACGDYLGWDRRAPAETVEPAADTEAEQDPRGVADEVAHPRDDQVEDRADAGASGGVHDAQRPMRGAGAAATSARAPAEREPAPRQAKEAATTQAGPGLSGADDGAAAPAPEVAETADRACPECGAESGPERRFCRRCGYRLVAAAVDATHTGVAPPPRPPTLWQKVTGNRTPGATPAARAAYRGALPMRYRAARAAAVVLPVLLLLTLLVVARGNPVTWGRGVWLDLRDETVLVDGVEAVEDPLQPAGDPSWQAQFAVDGSTGTAWGPVWQPDPDGAEPEACRDGATSPAREALLLSWPSVVDLRKIEVVGGLPADDPQADAIRRPLELELRFEESCQAVTLNDDAERQTVELSEGRRASQVRIAVMSATDVDAPESPDRVAISSIRLLARPD